MNISFLDKKIFRTEKQINGLKSDNNVAKTSSYSTSGIFTWELSRKPDNL